MEIKASIQQTNCEHQAQQAVTVYDHLSPQQKCLVGLAKEKGASSWLSVLPLDDHVFSLQKGPFKDAICLRYGWKPPNTPTKCNCGSVFSTNHGMICPMGGFPTIRHNKLRDVTASLLSEVCHNVATEPRLQPLNGESMTHRTAITTDDARFDIRARGFWSAAQDAYFDIRVLTRMHQAIGQDPSLRPIRSMRTSRNGHMASVFEMSSVGSSHLLCFPPLVGWVRKPQYFTKG